MAFEEFSRIVSGQNPQSASYGDIITAVQSQYTPQSQFYQPKSLLDSIGTLLPEKRGIAYGSLLQAQPRTPIKLFGSTAAIPIKNPDAAASVDSGLIKISNVDTGKITDNSDLSKTLVYNNDFTNTLGGGTSGVDTSGVNTGLFGTKITGTDVANVAGTIAPIAALAGNSDLVKTAIALNLIGSAADIRTEQDVINLGAKIAMLAAGPAGNALAAGLGLATDNTPMTVNALLGAINPTLGLVNTISGNLTGYNLGNVVNGLLNAPEGSISEYGLLGAANIGNSIVESRKAAGIAYDKLEANTLRVLAELGDKDAIETLRAQSAGSTGSTGSAYNPIADLGTARGNSYFNLFTPIATSGGGGGNLNPIITRATLAE
jgi:hypothetical protein